MSFAPTIHKIVDPFGGFVGQTDLAWDALKPKTPAPAPAVPDVNDAASAAQQQTDAMRARRGMLANIYAGNLNQSPTVGSNQLGS